MLTQRRSILVAAILAIHIAAIPIAVAATISYFGTIKMHETFHPRRQIEVQMLWTPIAIAQLSLLSAYLGLGSGKSYLRCVLFFLGIAIVGFFRAWARQKIGLISILDSKAIRYEASFYIFFQALPTLLYALTLFLGRLAYCSRPSLRNGSLPRTSIADLFVVTFLAAAAIATAKLAANEPTVFQTNYQSIAINSGYNFLCLVGCLIAAYTRYWWIGIPLIGLGVFLTLRLFGNPLTSGLVSWQTSLYPWLVVLVTLFVIRWFCQPPAAATTVDTAKLGSID